MSDIDPTYEALVRHYNNLMRDYEALLLVACIYEKIIRRLMKNEE